MWVGVLLLWLLWLLLLRPRSCPVCLAARCNASYCVCLAGPRPANPLDPIFLYISCTGVWTLLLVCTPACSFCSDTLASVRLPPTHLPTHLLYLPPARTDPLVYTFTLLQSFRSVRLRHPDQPDQIRSDQIRSDQNKSDRTRSVQLRTNQKQINPGKHLGSRQIKASYLPLIQLYRLPT